MTNVEIMMRYKQGLDLQFQPVYYDINSKLWSNLSKTGSINFKCNRYRLKPNRYS